MIGVVHGPRHDARDRVGHRSASSLVSSTRAHGFRYIPGSRRRPAAAADERFPPPRERVDFDAFFEDVFPSLFRYCTRLTGDADAAEDVAQEAFLRFVRDGVEGPPNALRVWLFKVATHLVRDRYRVRENRRRLLEQNPVTRPAPPDPEADAARAEAVAAVRGALDELAPRDRQLLLMRSEGFSYREMAEAVGVKSTSVGTLLARAQERFVEAYEGRPAGSGPGEDH